MMKPERTGRGMEMATLQLNMIILYCENMETMVDFYKNKLGLPLKHPKDINDFKEVHWVELDAFPCTLALHYGGKRRIGEDSPEVVFEVKEDLKMVREKFLEKGVKLSDINEISPNELAVKGTDPEGNRFWIVQYLKPSE